MDSDHLSIYIEQYCHNNSNVMEKIFLIFIFSWISQMLV